jgi:DNA replication protein DnaC
MRNGFIKACDIAELAELRELCTPRQAARPKPQSVAAIESFFREQNYRPLVPQLYRALVNYGAAELEGLNTRGLLLKGDCGIGKTLGVRLLAARFKWAFVSAVDYASAYVTQSETALERLADGLNFFGEPPRVLVIDDLGAEPQSLRRYGDERNVLAYVLERRYRIGFQRQRSRTIVTTNLTDAEIARRYGARISDRLNEMADFVCASAPSLRR